MLQKLCWLCSTHRTLKEGGMFTCQFVSNEIFSVLVLCLFKKAGWTKPDQRDHLWNKTVLNHITKAGNKCVKETLTPVVTPTLCQIGQFYSTVLMFLQTVIRWTVDSKNI